MMATAQLAYADEPPVPDAAPPIEPRAAHSGIDDTARAIRDLVAEQQRLKAQLAAQEARIAHAEAERAATPPVLFGIGPRGFFLGTRDGNFQLRIRSVIQADGRSYLDADQHEADAFLIRRARLYVEGSIGDHFEYRLMPDFAGGQVVLFDAWVNVRFWDFFQLRAGKMKTPFSVERLQQEQYLLFDERSLVSAIAPDRDVGVDLHGEAWHGRAHLRPRGARRRADGNSVDVDSNFGKDVVLRAFALPFLSLHRRWLDHVGFGLAYDYGKQAGSSAATGLAPYRTAGQQTFFSWLVDTKGVTTAFAHGTRWRIDPQLYAYVGPVGVLAEYTRSTTEITNGTKSADLTNQAWNVEASVVLTGEDASFDGVSPSGRSASSSRARRVRARGAHQRAARRCARLPALRRPDEVGAPCARLGRCSSTGSSRATFASALMYERTIFERRGARPRAASARPRTCSSAASRRAF